MSEENNTPASEEQAAGEQAQAAGPQFAIQRIYLKDMSFEAPMGVASFQKQWQPKVNQELNTKVTKIDAENFEVVLTLTITVKQEEETAFLVEVQQAGLFRVAGMNEGQLAQVLNSTAPNILFPYAREVVDNVITKGTFPALMLPPVNFDALFAQAVQQQKAQAQQAQAEGAAVN